MRCYNQKGKLHEWTAGVNIKVHSGLNWLPSLFPRLAACDHALPLWGCQCPIPHPALRGLSLHFLPPFLGKHTSLYKNTISFDVCLSALVCLKGFSKVCWHFLIAYSAQLLFSSWAIILGKASTSSIFCSAVRICGCALKQEGRPREVSGVSLMGFVRYQGNSGWTERLAWTVRLLSSWGWQTELGGQLGRCSGERESTSWVCVGDTLYISPL